MDFKEQPIRSYPFKNNRLLVIDWASLSYHQLWSMRTKSSKQTLGSILPEDEEMIIWRTKMFNRMLDYIKLFNPMDIILCLEGKKAWRRNFVRDYYNKEATIYYDANSYYVNSDNYTFKVDKIGDDQYDVVKIPLKQKAIYESLKHRQLCDMPEDKRDMLWSIKTTTGTPILPSYKGKRAASAWDFSVDKKYWQEYKDQYAMQIAPFFRAKAVRCEVAEGDDMIYASAKKYAPDYDDVIIITRDSDMSQIDIPGVKIFNHTSGNFVRCAYPQQYLAAKVLSGDTSDNIRGMAFVDQKTGAYKPTKETLISEGAAVQLLENCPNIFEVAKANGWSDQYIRNRTLIDLSWIPQDISEQVNQIIDQPAPELAVDWDKTAEWGIPESKTDYYKTLQQFGFFAVLSRDSADPENFKGDVLVQREAGVMTQLTRGNGSIMGDADTIDDAIRDVMNMADIDVGEI